MESLNYLEVFQGKHPKALQPKKRELADFQCAICGNCEKNYHVDPIDNVNNGFCMRFFQNVGLEEKNVACWTSKPHQYFEELSKLSPQEKKEHMHKTDKRVKHLKIDFSQNQLNLF